MDCSANLPSAGAGEEGASMVCEKCSALEAGANEPVKALSGVKGLTYAVGFAAAAASSAIGVAALAAAPGDNAFSPPIASIGGFSLWSVEKMVVLKVVMGLLSWFCELIWPLVNSAYFPSRGWSHSLCNSADWYQ